eukprot:m.855784 g.855784  ORF g.855784 m.855784 type:complete len:109 (-) comp23510_c0_seq27:126-452(-)
MHSRTSLRVDQWLAASVGGVAHIDDEMLYHAAVACADTMTLEEQADGRTFPTLSRIREVSQNVACAVIRVAHAQGLCTKITDAHMEDLEQHVHSKMYYPHYVPIIEKN